MEQYRGIKFDVNVIDTIFPNFPEQKDLITWGRKLCELGCIPTYPDPIDHDRTCSAGNLSIRSDDHFIITAAGSHLGKLSDTDFVEVLDVDVDAQLITAAGMLEPSSETMLHGEIYTFRKDIRVIFHGHNDLILKYADTLGLRSTKKHYPYGSVKLLQSVIHILNESVDFIVMKNHGFISLGKTCQEAGNLVIKVLSKIEKEIS